VTGVHVTRVLAALERYYDAKAEQVEPFLRADDAPDAREVLHVRHHEDDGVEIALVLPRRVAEAPWAQLSLDEQCQRIEGASHFLMLCERARNERQTTQLELEIQAEVDKWLVLSRAGQLDAASDRSLRRQLYDDVSYAHDPNTVEGDRYRLASRLAARFTKHLAEHYALRGRFRAMRAALAEFFHLGQGEKLRLMSVTFA
jgi:hypothetical protein